MPFCDTFVHFIRDFSMAPGKSHKCRCASELINRGLATPCADIDMGQILFMKWLVAWRHQVIIRFNIDFSSTRPVDL